MAYVKVTGYVEVDEAAIPNGDAVLTAEAEEDIRLVRIDDLDDLRFSRDDRP